jgi:hypothetical protein
MLAEPAVPLPLKKKSSGEVMFSGKKVHAPWNLLYQLLLKKEIIWRGDVFWKEGTYSLEPAVPLT